MTDSKPQDRLPELDALRGIAALIVVLFHYTWRGPIMMPGLQALPWGLAWGHYGVELFFAISGFVIFMTLERTRSTADFIVSRISRLFPAYWAGIILTTVAVTVLGADSLAQPASVVLTNFTMLQGFLYLPSVDGVYWSLLIELAFYACMLALWRGGLLGRIETILLGWIALKLLFWLVPALPSRLALLLLVQYIPCFAIGIAAYRVRAGKRLWRQQVPVLLAGLAAVAITQPFADAVVYLAVGVVFYALVANRLTRLNQPLLLWLGALSYPVYLIHQNLGYALMAVLERAGVPPIAAIGCAIAAAFGLAQLIHVRVEQPALSLIRGWWRGRRQLQPA